MEPSSKTKIKPLALRPRASAEVDPRFPSGTRSGRVPPDGRAGDSDDL
jgi:hypothetical protein